MTLLKVIHFLGLLLCIKWSMLPAGHCQITEADMPLELKECAQSLASKTGAVGMESETSEIIYYQCLRQFVLKEKGIQWNNLNITKKEKGYINSLISSLVRRSRKKRTVYTRDDFPEVGLRIRREYRMISDAERLALHRALNKMKMTGQYDALAKLHTSSVIPSVYGGPNFHGWHRVYLYLFEEALGRINPNISLPYLDSTLDDNMFDPNQSIIWTDAFLGTGVGRVRTGPFGNWNTPTGPLTRNIGDRGMLLTEKGIRSILTRCRLRDITAPTALDEFSLERISNGLHDWVGGHMSDVNTAAHDPVFFFHHAFVDYIWEQFRNRQRNCGVNPVTDYPPAIGQHAAERPMASFPQYRNIDGYSDSWTKFHYKYERSPSCFMRRPFCGSVYLRCNVTLERCVSAARIAGERLSEDETASATRLPRSMASVMQEGNFDESTIHIGPRFTPPLPESREQETR